MASAVDRRNEADLRTHLHSMPSLDNFYRVRINFEGEKGLQRLTGIVPIVAKRIVQERPFKSCNELVSDVRGITSTMLNEWTRQGFQLDFSIPDTGDINGESNHQGSYSRRPSASNLPISIPHRKSSQSEMEEGALPTRRDIPPKFLQRPSKSDYNDSNPVSNQKALIARAKRSVNDQLTRLEDSASGAWLREQLEELNGESRASLVSKVSLLQSQMKASTDQSKDLISSSQSRENILKDAIQRQQDARLRKIALNRIKRTIQIPFFYWKDVRDQTIKFQKVEYKLILKSLNKLLKRCFYGWSRLASYWNHVRRCGVKNLAMVLNSLRKKYFRAWQVYHLGRLKMLNAFSRNRTRTWRRNIAVTFECWITWHQWQQSALTVFTNIRVRLMTCFSSKAFIFWRDYGQEQRLYSKRTMHCRSHWCKIQQRKAWAVWRLRHTRRKAHSRLRLQVLRTEIISLKSLAFANLQNNWVSRSRQVKEVVNKSRRVLCCHAFAVLYDRLQTRKSNHRNGVKVVVKSIRRSVHYALTRWAEFSQRRVTIQRMSKRAGDDKEKCASRAIFQCWMKHIVTQTEKRNQGVKLLMKILRSLLRLFFESWILGVSERGKQRMVSEIHFLGRTVKHQHEYILPVNLSFHAWNRYIMSRALLKVVGIRVLLKSLRNCMGTAFLSWKSKRTHSFVGRYPVQTEVRFVLSKIAKFDLARAFEFWTFQIKGILRFRRDGQRLVLRCVSSRIHPAFRAWAECAHACWWAPTAFAQMVAQRYKFRCLKIFLRWQNIAQPRHQIQNAITHLQRQNKAYQREQNSMLYFLQWALSTAKSEGVEYPMNGDQLAFYHSVAIRQTWLQCATYFDAWKNAIDVSGSLGSERHIIDPSAVVMSNPPNLKFQGVESDQDRFLRPRSIMDNFVDD